LVTEHKLADLIDASAAARDEADALEQQLGREAEHIIDLFLAGDAALFAIS
jgi:hypothetical protein